MRQICSKATIGLSLLAIALAGARVAARPFTLEDLLSLERFDYAEVSPDGRRLIMQTEAPYDTAARFDVQSYTTPLLGRIKIADLQDGGAAKDLLPPESGAGYLAGPISPTGRWMVVQRLKGHAWDTGVVDLRTGAAKWFGVPAETATWGRSIQWRSERSLIVLGLPQHTLPWLLKTTSQTTQRTSALWRQAAAGKLPTAMVVGSGVDLGVWSPPAPIHLQEIDVETGNVRELARGGFIDLEVSPDGRFAAILTDKEALAPSADSIVRVGTPGRRRALTLVNLTTDQVIEPFRDRDLAPGLLAWSPVGERLLVFGRSLPARWEDGDLLEIDANAGQTIVRTDGKIRPEVDYHGSGIPTVRADWIGTDPLVFGRPIDAPKARADWYRLTTNAPVNLTAGARAVSPRLAAISNQTALMFAGQTLYRLSDSGQAKALIEAPDLRQIDLVGFGRGDRFEVNATPRRNWAWVAEKETAHRFDTSGEKLDVMIPSDGSVVVAAEGVIATRRADARGVSTVTVHKSGRGVAVLTVNAALADVDPMVAVPIPHKDPLGRPTTSWLFLPPGAKRSAPPPLIVLPYPGASYTKMPGRYGPDSTTFTPNARLLAAHGYAVLAPSLPRDFTAMDPADGLASQILAAVDAVAAEGLADTKRMVLWGHSFGGYGALVTAAQTDRFRAIVAQAGKSNIAAGWGSFAPFYAVSPEYGPMINASIGWAETGQGGLGTSPWHDPDRYTRNSPFFMADKIRTPVFIIQGDQDFVTLANGQAMFAALYRQNRDARFMTLFGEGHLISSPANVRIIYETVLPWLDRTLSGKEASVTHADGSEAHPSSSIEPKSPSP